MKINIGTGVIVDSFEVEEELEIILSKKESPTSKELKISIDKNGITIFEVESGMLVRGPTNWTDAICHASLQPSLKK